MPPLKRLPLYRIPTKLRHIVMNRETEHLRVESNSAGGAGALHSTRSGELYEPQRRSQLEPGAEPGSAGKGEW